MKKQSDVDFYRMRLEQERALQRSAEDEAIARVHGVMAERYEALLKAAIEALGGDRG